MIRLLRHWGMSPDSLDTSLCELAVSRSTFLLSLGTRGLGSRFLLLNNALKSGQLRSLVFGQRASLLPCWVNGSSGSGAALLHAEEADSACGCSVSPTF